MHKIKRHLEAKTVQRGSKQICWCILMQEDNRGWTFSQEKVLLWIHILARNILFILFIIKQMFNSQDIHLIIIKLFSLAV